jgi:hypothetical protein
MAAHPVDVGLLPYRSERESGCSISWTAETEMPVALQALFSPPFIDVIRKHTDNLWKSYMLLNWKKNRLLELTVNFTFRSDNVYKPYI